MVQCQPSSLQSEDLTLFVSAQNQQHISYVCLFISCLILLLWAISQIFLLSLDISKVPVFLIVIGIAWQTFLYTGLFITAHDAMHGVAFPKNPQINNFIGKIALLFYALLSYKELLKKHWLHHRHPATESDPDYYDSQHQNFFAWYFHFMKSYWQWRQVWGFTIIYQGIKYFLHLDDIRLNLFWIIPSVLSSFQLFYFGTFLPHKRLEGGYTNTHCAHSIPLPTLWSFITCYHFGYHKEHHEYPHLPWWKLPQAYKNSLNIA